jgi:hypothetical protein
MILVLVIAIGYNIQPRFTTGRQFFLKVLARLCSAGLRLVSSCLLQTMLQKYRSISDGH